MQVGKRVSILIQFHYFFSCRKSRLATFWLHELAERVDFVDIYNRNMTVEIPHKTVFFHEKEELIEPPGWTYSRIRTCSFYR